MARKISTTVYLEPAQLAALQERAAFLQTSVAVLVRRGVAHVLEGTRNEVSPLELLSAADVAALPPLQRLALAVRLGFELPEAK